MTTPLLEHEFRGQMFCFESTPMARALIEETFGDNYKVFATGIEFRDGDVILDLGACEGTFSIMMAKTFPQTRVIALEPVQRTYDQLLRNIKLNSVTNIEPYNFGVGKETARMTMIVGKNDYSGGSSGVITFKPEDHIKVDADLKNLQDVWKDLALDRVRVMKIDIEGMEYDVLYSSGDILKKVDYLTGEFHTNLRLEVKGFRMNGLASWCSNRTNVICIESCPMAE